MESQESRRRIIDPRRIPQDKAQLFRQSCLTGDLGWFESQQEGTWAPKVPVSSQLSAPLLGLFLIWPEPQFSKPLSRHIESTS